MFISLKNKERNSLCSRPPGRCLRTRHSEWSADNLGWKYRFVNFCHIENCKETRLRYPKDVFADPWFYFWLIGKHLFYRWYVLICFRGSTKCEHFGITAYWWVGAEADRAVPWWVVGASVLSAPPSSCRHHPISWPRRTLENPAEHSPSHVAASDATLHHLCHWTGSKCVTLDQRCRTLLGQWPHVLFLVPSTRAVNEYPNIRISDRYNKTGF